jgi:hypothetical protein
LQIVAIDAFEFDLYAQALLGLYQEFVAQQGVGGWDEVTDPQQVKRTGLGNSWRTAGAQNSR